MLFKNILFGLGGTAVVGGVGYGIYSSSQVNKKDENNIPTIGDSNGENKFDSSGDGNGNALSTKEDEGKSADIQGEGSGIFNVPGSSKTKEGPSGDPGA